MKSFETIATIAVTLIGFISVFIGVRSSDIQIKKTEFVDFVESAIATIILAFVPELLRGIIHNEHSLWRVACFIIAICHLTIMLHYWWLHHKQERKTSRTLINWVFVVFSIVVLCLQFAVSFGFLLNHGYHIYLLSLLWFVCNSLLTFYGIVSVVFKNDA